MNRIKNFGFVALLALCLMMAGFASDAKAQWANCDVELVSVGGYVYKDYGFIGKAVNGAQVDILVARKSDNTVWYSESLTTAGKGQWTTTISTANYIYSATVSDPLGRYTVFSPQSYGGIEPCSHAKDQNNFEALY
ncbi:MAG TPA: hypothetical protein VK892_05320 [Pyrinomonadaceae bacterium]|nr:hypothetical protein [Pyrinomonadaceae bacterium]